MFANQNHQAKWNGRGRSLLAVALGIALTAFSVRVAQADFAIDAPAQKDTARPGNTPEQAALIQAGQYQFQCWDDHWFTVQLSTTGQVSISIQGNQGDLDLYFFDAFGNTLGYSEQEGSNEQVSGTLSPGLYYFVVTPWQNQGGAYTLNVSLPNGQGVQPEPVWNPEPEYDTEPDYDEPAVESGTGNRYALVVGIDKYSPSYGASDLSCCVNDAKGIRDNVLAGSQWSSNNVRMLTDSQATRSNIRGYLQQLAAQTGQGDMIVYVQSSHGGQYGGTDTYLCTHDADYPDYELGQDLALFNRGQRVVVIVDACFSGGMFRNPDWAFAEKVMQAYKAQRKAEFAARGIEAPRDLGNNVAFMTASRHDQVSMEGNGHGFYSGGLIKACQTRSADTNNDGVYSFAEIHQYAANRASQMGDQQAQSYNDNLLTGLDVREVSGSAGNSGSNGGSYNDTDWNSLGMAPIGCGAGAVEALAVGLFSLLGIVAPVRRRRVRHENIDIEAIIRNEQ